MEEKGGGGSLMNCARHLPRSANLQRQGTDDGRVGGGGGGAYFTESWLL